MPDSDLSADSDITQAWYNLITMYTQRTLTRPRDRLNALAGIAEQYHQYWPYSKYFASLWEHQLPGSLLWSNHRHGDYHRRPDICHAPSWSWASRDGRAGMDWCSMNNGMYCTVIHCNITPAKKVNPISKVEDGGILVLEAIIQQATWSTDKDGFRDLFTVTGAPLDQYGSESGQSNIGLAYSDAIEKQQDANVYVAFVGQNVKEQCAHGLVLVPATDQIANTEAYNYPVFHRVGSFEAPLYWSSFPETWLQSK
ncbi:hypothetical protein IW261DRAFT_1572378 [Armillaria novae-zelandiae]|uniref:Uncharacterized protein n=1 Tax=Armillaria novae-zelandiae TaxID=153914 RepID=A0AA39NT76_9AGAR|nr:hypothetical protein IW261DRAFT_1572378 [Armillaria novae-zelandiae]